MALSEDGGERVQKTGMQVLRSRIRAARVPAARPDNLRLATWNIRELGKNSRLDESIRLIAAILATFDICSVVELRDDLTDMRRILRVLGPKWDIVFSDYLRDAGGNRERSAFVYNRERVTFTGLASTGEGPRKRVGDEYVPIIPWWRPPFMASFRANRFEFVLLAAHVRWGARPEARRAELGAVADWIVQRAKERFFKDSDLFVVGDFNVQLGGERPPVRGLAVPEAISDGVRTDLAQMKRYDQILCLTEDAPRFTGKAGAVDFYRGDHRALLPGRRATKNAFTFQISDHLPLWAELAMAGHENALSP